MKRHLELRDHRERELIVKNISEFTIGWIDTSIGALIKEDARLFSRWSFILITSLDSEVELHASLAARAMLSRGGEYETLGAGLLLPGWALQDLAATSNFFTGFDELWCFQTRPIEAKPSILSIVAPLNLDQDDPPASLVSWMTSSRCSLGLGDGIGLNYAASADGWTALKESFVVS
jgi:hypothetical protein